MGKRTGIVPPDPNEIEYKKVGIEMPDYPTERSAIVNYMIMTFTLLIQFAIIFYHMFSFANLSSSQKLLWILTYSSLQLVATYLLSIQFDIILSFVCVEIIMMWIISKSKSINQDFYDHVVILFAELNVYIWILYGNDLFISIIIPILCEILIATSNKKFNTFQMRSIITYCLIKACARISIPTIQKWDSITFAIYALMPLFMAQFCNKYQLSKYNTYWIIYIIFHIAFWTHALSQ